MGGIYIPDYLVGTGQAIPVHDHGDLVDRNALIDKVTEVAVRKWNGSHFTTQIIRVIQEEALLAAPAVIPKEADMEQARHLMEEKEGET